MSLHIDRDGRRLQRACNVFDQSVYEKASDAEGKHTNISTWHYDSLGRVTCAVCDGKSYEYIYDAYGNLKEKRSSGKRLVSYTYDRAGQITEIKAPAGVCTRYKYDVLGRRSRIYNDDGLDFWKSGGTAFQFAMPMTKPGTESERRMHREKFVIFTMKRTS